MAPRAAAPLPARRLPVPAQSHRYTHAVIYRRETYRIRPGMADQLTRYFEECLLPDRLRHGATLVGRWVSESQDEAVAIWAYADREECEQAEATLRHDPRELDRLVTDRRADFLQPTGQYAPPRHILAVSGYITDPDGRVLLVRTAWRSDTWELPGGQVEEGEEPVAALVREIREETGIEAEIHALAGVSYSTSRGGVCNLVFRGAAVGGSLATSAETLEVAFISLSEANLAKFVTRPHFRARVLDAMAGRTVPYEAYRLRPYALIRRTPGA